MLGALLKQLLWPNPVKCHSIIEKLQEMKARGTPLKPESARTLLGESLQQFNSSYICIDALDECNQKHRPAFLRSLNDLFRGSRLQLRIFITGRPHVEQYVRNEFVDQEVCKMTLLATEDDITKYINHHMESARSIPGSRLF